jgi:hypothetical protein
MSLVDYFSDSEEGEKEKEGEKESEKTEIQQKDEEKQKPKRKKARFTLPKIGDNFLQRKNEENVPHFLSVLQEKGKETEHTAKLLHIAEEEKEEKQEAKGNHFDDFLFALSF